jgi:hypothetical protein
MRETTLNRGQGATNFTKERHNVNIGVRKVRCPHKFCQDCSIVIDNSDVSDLYSKSSTTESYLSSDIESAWNIYTLCWFNNNYSKTILSKLKSGHKYIQYSTIIIKCNFFPYLYY